MGQLKKQGVRNGTGTGLATGTGMEMGLYMHSCVSHANPGSLYQYCCLYKYIECRLILQLKHKHTKDIILFARTLLSELNLHSNGGQDSEED